MISSRTGLLLAIAVVLLCGVAFAGQFYVDAQAGDDSNAGTSPADAWLTITQALSSVRATSSDPATITVAAGTYSASTNGESFPLVMMSYISLVGAGTDATIVNADGDAYHVIKCDAVREVTIKSLTIKGGNANGIEQNALGGGVLCRYCTNLEIDRCDVTDNTATGGGGIAVGSSTVRIVGCGIVSNVVHGTADSEGASFGAGVYSLMSSLTIDRCVISDNCAYPGIGQYATGQGAGVILMNMSPPAARSTDARSRGLETTISNCIFSDNASEGANSAGGGLYSLNVNPTVEGCVFRGNSAFGGGGIIWLEMSYFRQSAGAKGGTQGLIKDCSFEENTASFGGGISVMDGSPTIENCLFTDNSASSGGGALEFEAYERECAPSIKNCTVVGNTPGLWGGGGIYCYNGPTPQVSDSIFWDNQGSDIQTMLGGSVTVSYSCVQTGYSGEGNISDDPLFVTGPLGDYYLSCTAAGQDDDCPCINAGSDTAEALGLNELTTRTDEQPDTGVVDMGYHYPLTSGAVPTIQCSLNHDSFSPGDLLVGSVGIENSGPDTTVDVYVAFVMPDGAILCISPTRIDFGIFPYQTDLSLPQGYSIGPSPVVTLGVPGGLSGQFLFAAALSTPGEFNIVGEASLFPFTLRAER